MTKLSIMEKLKELNKLDQITIGTATLKSKSFYLPKGLSTRDCANWQVRYREYLKNCRPEKYKKVLARNNLKNSEYYHNMNEEQRARWNEKKRITRAKRMENNTYYNNYNKKKEVRRKQRMLENPESLEKQRMGSFRYYYKKRAIKYNLITLIPIFINNYQSF